MIEKIDLIKMDIEMHEPQALQGFGKYLLLYKPIVFIEVLSDEVAESLNRIITVDCIRLHLLERGKVAYVTEFKAIYGKWNYIFFHKEMENKVKENTTLRW